MWIREWREARSPKARAGGAGTVGSSGAEFGGILGFSQTIVQTMLTRFAYCGGIDPVPITKDSPMVAHSGVIT